MAGRNGSTRVVGQLTLEVESASDDDLAIAGRMKVGGALRVETNLMKDQAVNVVVTDVDGEVLAREVGEVNSVKLTTKRTESGSFVERLHSIALQA